MDILKRVEDLTPEQAKHVLIDLIKDNENSNLDSINKIQDPDLDPFLKQLHVGIKIQTELFSICLKHSTKIHLLATGLVSGE